MTYGLLSELTEGRLRGGRPECCQGALGASLLIRWDLPLPRATPMCPSASCLYVRDNYPYLTGAVRSKPVHSPARFGQWLNYK